MVRKKNKVLLVPVDFSLSAEAALLFAADLAEKIDATIQVLHVVHDPGDAPGYYKIPDRDSQLKRMEDVGAEMLDEFMSRVTRENPDAAALQSATTMLVVGLPVSRIMEVVDHTQPWMVVMGNTGRTRLSQLMLGSKASQAVKLCPVPITIVRAPDSDPED